MKTKSLSTLLLALAGAALITGSSRAATSVTVGDIFAAFRSTGSDTIKAYIVDLGSYTQFTNATTFGNFSFGSSGTTGADLAHAFGTNWYNRSDITWGIYGTKNTGSPQIVFAGAEESSNGTQTTPYTPLGNSFVATKTGVTTVNSGFTNVITTTASTNGINAGFQTGTGAGTYVAALDNNLGNVFYSASFISTGTFEASPSSFVDLYAIKSATTDYYGTLQLDGNGVISAVPEPSTYALLGAGALLLVATARARRSRE